MDAIVGADVRAARSAVTRAHVAPRRLRVAGRLLLAALSFVAAGCADDEQPPTLAERLERRYDGDLRCIEAIVSQVDDTTAAALADIAEHGVEPSGQWYAAPVLDPLGRIIAC